MIALLLVCAALPPRRGVAAGATEAPQARRPVIDSISFGDAASEEAHALAEMRTVVARGGLGGPCRRVGSGGLLTFALKCDPDEQNYLTVRLWGSDTGNGQLYLYDGETHIGRYQGYPPELDLLTGDPHFPGRFYYSTCMVPLAMTKGKDRVTLGIGSAGRPTPYSDKRKEADQKNLSRGVYRAYAGTDPFFVPGPDEKQGAATRPAGSAKPPEGRSIIQHLHGQLDLAVERMLGWQYLGAEWEKLVADGRAPASLTDAMVIGGVKKPGATEDEWKDNAARRLGGNRVGLLVPEVLARAYHAKWSKHRGRKDLVERVVRALDYFRAAQGSNGGFDDIWQHRWVGGPGRRRAGNCLEGFGQMGLGPAYMLLRDEIEAGGYLDMPVDDDGDPATPRVARREAWADLLASSRDYLTSDIGRGHAPNQDMVNQLAAYLGNRALARLDPGRAWPERKIMEFVRSACGLDMMANGGTWISRKGISCEPHGTTNGGFCGNYGGHVVSPLFRLAELTGDRAVRRRALQVADALSKFRTLSLDAEFRPCVRLEGVVTWRNNRTPGKVSYGASPHGAVVFRDPVSRREIELAAKHGHHYRIRLDRYWAHFIAVTSEWMREVDHLETALALPASAHRLPFEPGGADFAWADEEAGAVVVKRGETRLVMSFNWRHGYRSRERSRKNAVTNNVARVHMTTPTVERIADVAMESTGGIGGFGGLYVCRYGPYIVAMNASEDRPFRLPATAWPARATHGTRRVTRRVARTIDLVSGATVAVGSTPLVPPRTTMVLLDASHADQAARRATRPGPPL